MKSTKIPHFLDSEIFSENEDPPFVVKDRSGFDVVKESGWFYLHPNVRCHGAKFISFVCWNLLIPTNAHSTKTYSVLFVKRVCGHCVSSICYHPFLRYTNITNRKPTVQKLDHWKIWWWRCQGGNFSPENPTFLVGFYGALNLLRNEEIPGCLGILRWIWPPPCNSGKWRLIEIPY